MQLPSPLPRARTPAFPCLAGTADEDASAADAAGGKSAPEPLDRSRTTLLVVDDTLSARYALARGLRKLGFRVLEAGTGEQALLLAPQCAAMLLDVRLPDIPGTEVCRRLRESPATAALPVLHVSSLPPSEHGAEIGDFEWADGYLVNPVDAVFAAELIEGLLQRGTGRG